MIQNPIFILFHNDEAKAKADSLAMADSIAAAAAVTVDSTVNAVVDSAAAVVK